MSRLLNVCLGVAVSIPVVALAQTAWAGEIKVFAEAPEVGDDGNLTGKATQAKELASEPGEEKWPLHIWGKIDKGAPGPLYIEFWGKIPGSGKPYKAWTYEKKDYDGEKFVLVSIELDGNVGFNRDKTYEFDFVQIDDKGKDLHLTPKAKVTLKYTEPPADEGEEDEGEEESSGGGGGDEASDQDAHDTLAGADGGAPPPVTPPAKKKGCHVGAEPSHAAGLLLLLALGFGLRHRRE